MPAPATRHIELLIPLQGAPTNATAPVVTGTRVVGQTLSTTDGTWNGSPSSYTYQWKRDGAAILAATANTYVAVTADIGHVITCAVTALSSHGTSSPVNSNGITIVAEIVGDDIQVWTAAGAGLGGSPGARVPSPTSVFDSVTDPEAGAGDVEYRAVYIKNTHLVRSWSSGVIWISSQTTSPTTDLAIGVATQPAGSDVAAIGTEQTAPIGVSFSAPTDEASGITIGTLAPGQARGLWLRWTVQPGTAETPSDTTTITGTGTPS